MPYSNYGEKSVDFMAPGVLINTLAPGGQFIRHSGTSMSAPIISGLIALTMNQFGGMNSNVLRRALDNSLIDPTKFNFSTHSTDFFLNSLKNYGIPNALKTFQYLEQNLFLLSAPPMNFLGHY
jgi:subtilisin family serine protease